MDEIKFEVRYIFYYYEGEEVSDCGGDYHECELLLNGKVIRGYGSYDDDKSEYVVDAFIDGYYFARGLEAPEDVKTINVPKLYE